MVVIGYIVLIAGLALDGLTAVLRVRKVVRGPGSSGVPFLRFCSASEEPGWSLRRTTRLGRAGFLRSMLHSSVTTYSASMGCF